MFARDVTDSSDAVLCDLVADRADKRIAGVGRTRKNATAFEDSSGLRDQTLLRMGGVNLDVGGIHSDLACPC